MPQPTQKQNTCCRSSQSSCCPLPGNSNSLPWIRWLQEAHKQAMEAVMARAQEHAMRMNDGKLTVEHMVLALSENPR
jgi:hypothetical protein